MIDADHKIQSIQVNRGRSKRYYRTHREACLEYQACYRQAQKEGVFAPVRIHKGPRKRRGRYSFKRSKNVS